MSTEPAADTPAYRYTAALANEIEQRWQRRWEERGTFHAPNPSGQLKGEVPADKLFVQDMFPYPSGAGLHVGHPLGFIGTDVYARYHRMTGRNVLHTMGFDAFGLPAEQYAVRTGQHPRETTKANIETYLRQIRRLGLGHDERRRISTIDPDYYRWTQWIFLQIYNSWFDADVKKARPIAELVERFKSGERATPDGRPWAELSAAEQQKVLGEHRLAYLSEAPVNWCPGLGTVLANEEVTSDGRSERGNFPVFRRNLRQWMMRITAYSDRLVDDLDRLDWPEKVKSMQRNWIGRSNGARVRFEVRAGEGAVGADERIEVFTTRPDTLFGATYVVLAPEHPLVDAIASPAQAGAIAAYRAEVARKSELDRQESKEKTGVPIGAVAVNPVNGAELPVYVADYVLMGYGTGAIMAVPGQDQRDWDFAKAFDLPIIRTVQPTEGFEGEAFTGVGPAINSGFLDGMDVAEAKKAIIAWLEERGAGEGTVQYKLRDWLFSRQRYWGEPFPIVYDEDGTPIALPESHLPVVLPEVDDYSPRTFEPDDANSEPSPPLTRAQEWVEVELDLGDGPKRYRRETNTMPNWAGSCWYQLRYVDPTEPGRFVDAENEQYWLGPRPAEHGANDPGGVDLYIGGVEHAVLHLLYSRFWQKVLFDLGHVSGDEPYRRLFNQGYIEAYAYTDARGAYVTAEEVVEKDGKFFHDGAEVSREYGKMGKSLKNVVTPDEMCANYGADTFRVYEMSMGPMDVSRPWATKDVVGAQRFLQRLWRNLVDEDSGELRVADVEPSEDALRLLHKTIAGVHDDYANLRYNTAVAKLIELNNHVTKHYPAGAPRALAGPVVQLLAPLAPHVAEELWERLGGGGDSLAHGPFPVAEERYLVEDTVLYPVQVGGKVKARVTVSASASPDEVKAAALGDPAVAALLTGEPRKVIVVPGRLVNIVL
ncbi:leucine--tRNA ligase [Actinosynnema pretiosum subsp. pretiosum]|uniref:Leucine--tRNA ligase n=2 Tax=Actinosynnema TaxID=40566 RepID=C6WSJ5_ACTMD|nr:leucine--tRNA ligase [Actinosynnema mirum]ACU40865.1 leucyl-tRNA synthetase [Actinosynnema mirum DSM 43827]AXX34378.1 Leucyl-tRNA synthetase [Actinosynnema pretiosum subsp. pretiosum]QUF01928.1 leucine--tRNA ligase [Actinosynnema pretiosum subsp. pretiosum]